MDGKGTGVHQGDTPGRYRRLVVEIRPERVLAGLDDAQRAAVTSDASLLCLVAGAGSGKTTVLTRRVAWRVVHAGADPEHVLVVTFTRKAATELRQRLARLGLGSGIRAATFHAAAFAQLRRYWTDRGRQAPALLDDPRPLLRRLLEDDSNVGDGKTPVGDSAVSALWSEVSWARARLVHPDDYPAEARRAGRRPPFPLERVAHFLGRYETEKRRRRVLDLDDLVLRCTHLLESDAAWAAAVRWQVRHLFVDEFQDVNPAQWRLLESWRHGREDLCVVGDPRQAIYAWNGADPTLLGRLSDLIPGTTVLHLDGNHRSTPQIVKTAASVLPASVLSTEAANVPPATRAEGTLPELHGFDDEEQEARSVARWIRVTRRPGRPWGHMAVVARTHARLEPTAQALSRTGIPFHRTASRGTSPALARFLGSLRATDRRLPLRAGVVDATSDQDAGEEGDEAWQLVAGLVEGHLTEEPDATVGSFLAWLTANHGDGEVLGGRSDGVVLATFHQAKGLEWRAVAVVGLEEGTMPIAYAQHDEALAEERRLLYVALTRAEEHLWCSWASRPSGQAAAVRGPSPFLGPIRAALASCGPLEPSASATRLAEVRRRLAAIG
jgi:DNA helicase II / ATP-dependent DNA helicase PcrA